MNARLPTPPRAVIADDGALIASCLAGSLPIAPPGSRQFSGPRRLPRAGSVDFEAARSQRRLVVAYTSKAYVRSGAMQTTFYVSGDGGQSWRRTETLPVSGASIGFAPCGDAWALRPDRATRTSPPTAA